MSPDTDSGETAATPDIPLLDSRISAVTVFRGYARVERVADIPVNGSVPARVRLGRLPLTLDDTSVQVRVETDDGGGAIPVAVDLRVGLETPPPPEDPPAELREKLQQAQRACQRLRSTLGVIDEELSLIQSLGVGGRPSGHDGTAPPPSPLAARRALLTLQEQRQEQLITERRALEEQIREADEARQVVEQELRQAGGSTKIRPNQLRKHIDVGFSTVGTGAPAKARIVVAYLVPGVRWAPSYKLQFDGDMSRVRVAVRASVAQRTGENWDEAQLTLSTASAQRWTELPKLTSVRIGRKQAPPAAVGWREPPVGAEALYDDHDRTFGGPSAPPPPPVPPDGTRDGEMAFGSGEAMPEEVWDDDDEVEVEYEESKLAAFEGAPDMAPPEPCMEVGAPPPVPKPSPMRSASAAGGMLGAAADMLGDIMPMSKSAAPRAKKQSKERRRARTEAFARGGAGGGPGGGYEDDFDFEEEAELTAAEALMEYGALRMAESGFVGRGKLHPAGAYDRYREQLPAAFQSHIGTFAEILARALQTAQDTANQTPPPGCVPDFPEFEYDYAYPTDAPVTIPSDGKFHTIPLTTREGSVEQRYIVVPRETQDVFRFVEWTNPLDAPLLDGPADVHVGGDYLVTTQLRFVAPRGGAKLGLGVEQGIAVARNTRFHEDTSGMLGGTLNLHHHIAVELRNNLTRPATIEVRERIPVTPEGEDDIEIDTATVEPQWKRYDPDEYHLRGGHRWVCTLAPGATQELEAEYVVKISSKQEIVGGNRREG